MSISAITDSKNTISSTSPHSSPLANRGRDSQNQYHPPHVASPYRSRTDHLYNSSDSLGVRGNGGNQSLLESVQFAGQPSFDRHRMPVASSGHASGASPQIPPPFENPSSPKRTVVPSRPYSQPTGSDPPVDSHASPQNPVREKPKYEQIHLAGRRTFSDDYRQNPSLQRSPRDRALSDMSEAKASSRSSQTLRYEDSLDKVRKSPESVVAANEREFPRIQYRRPSVQEIQSDRTKSPDSFLAPNERGYSRHQYHRPDIQDIQADRPIASREGPDPEDRDVYNPNATFFRPAGPPIDFVESHFMLAPGLTQLRHGEGADRMIENGRLSLPTNNNSFQSRPLGLDAHLRKSLEESQMSHKPMLGQGYDGHRRAERGSPLPQAVQGASSQPAGSGRDPSIKSEFGRMFSGLGSGVGSTPQPMLPQSNGSPAPVRPGVNGDERDGESTSRQVRREEGAECLPNASSKGKRTYDYDGRFDSDEGRATPPTLMGYGGKRNKLSHPGHHHHHHPYGHQ